MVRLRVLHDFRLPGKFNMLFVEVAWTDRGFQGDTFRWVWTVNTDLWETSGLPTKGEAIVTQGTINDARVGSMHETLFEEIIHLFSKRVRREWEAAKGLT